MLTPAFSGMSALQWMVMPSDTNGVESLNKCAIDHTSQNPLNLAWSLPIGRTRR